MDPFPRGWYAYTCLHKVMSRERRWRLAALHRKLVVQGTAATDDYVTWAFSILDYPYMAKLDFTDGSQCTGQVVARQWVLTAAHCFTATDVTQGATWAAEVAAVKVFTLLADSEATMPPGSPLP